MLPHLKIIVVIVHPFSHLLIPSIISIKHLLYAKHWGCSGKEIVSHSHGAKNLVREIIL